MAFEDITPEDFGVESENMEEVAELPDESADEGAKEQETTEPASEEPSVQDDKTNSAFAEMRRAKEEAERKVQELEQNKEEEIDYSEQAIDEYVDGLSDDEVLELLAETEGITTEEVKARIDARAEALEKENVISNQKAEIEALKEQIASLEVESATEGAEKEMAQDLAEIQKFDPGVKSLDDLPPSYMKFRNTQMFDGTYMSATESYFAAQQMAERTKVKPAQEIGKVNRSEAESEYYTSWDEINAMTSEEKTKNADKIMRSLSRLK